MGGLPSERHAEIALASIAQHRDHDAILRQAPGQLAGGPDIGPGRNPHEEPFLLRAGGRPGGWDPPPAPRAPPRARGAGPRTGAPAKTPRGPPPPGGGGPPGGVAPPPAPPGAGGR